MSIPLTTDLGNGEEWCQTSRQLRLKLNNTMISFDDVHGFQNYMGCPEFDIKFNIRPTVNRWGTAWRRKGRIGAELYRKSVKVFLHEFAHCYLFKLNQSDGHGPNFGKTMDYIIEMWFKYKGKEM